MSELPPYFHNITTLETAKTWLSHMLTESKLFLIKEKKKNKTIGFLFIYEADDSFDTIHAHIGYLLGEEFWGLGYASELVRGFIHYAKKSTSWKKLVAGVAKNNSASVKLLKKLDFKNTASLEETVFTFEYDLKS